MSPGLRLGGEEGPVVVALSEHVLRSFASQVGTPPPLVKLSGPSIKKLCLPHGMAMALCESLNTRDWTSFWGTISSEHNPPSSPLLSSPPAPADATRMEGGRSGHKEAIT